MQIAHNGIPCQWLSHTHIFPQHSKSSLALACPTKSTLPCHFRPCWPSVLGHKLMPGHDRPLLGMFHLLGRCILGGDCSLIVFAIYLKLGYPAMGPLSHTSNFAFSEALWGTLCNGVPSHEHCLAECERH